jgi:hypothetical protein
MVIPVWEPTFWNSTNTKTLLTETLQFLTDDEYAFEFVERSTRSSDQGILHFKELPGSLPKVDLVVLFSGRRPILISHRSTPVIDSRQKQLVGLLRNDFPGWVFPHVSMWLNSAGDKRTIEFSQRSRSFLFTSLGILAASLLEIDDVRLCDNGVVSINLPRSGQNYGTFLSRSTHPRFLTTVQEFMRQVVERPNLKIENTLIFKTKKETLEIIAASGHPELLQESVSCAHVEGKTRLQPHCGVCTQCIDRRFAALSAGLEAYDLLSRYEKDLFVDTLREGDEQTHAENYVRFALALESAQTPDQLFETFPQLYDCLPEDGDVEAFAHSMWELFQRHQRTVNSVLERQIQEHSAEIRRAVLPADCLLRIVGSGHHTKDPHFRYIERLRGLLSTSLPIFFQSEKPKNERHVQDAGEAALKTARESLERESPQIPFGVISTKPDFARIQHDGISLFVEFKYPKDRRRLNSIVTEMTSRVTI